MYGTHFHTPRIMGADCAVSSLETGWLHCEPSTKSLGEASFRMATACEKVWSKGQTHGSQGLNNLRGGNAGTTGKMLQRATLLCGSNQCLSLLPFAVRK